MLVIASSTSAVPKFPISRFSPEIPRSSSKVGVGRTTGPTRAARGGSGVRPIKLNLMPYGGSDVDALHLAPQTFPLSQASHYGPWQGFASNPHTDVRPGRLSEHLMRRREALHFWLCTNPR